MELKWIDDTTAVINGGSKYMFKGIVRGQTHPPITYFADSYNELLDGLVLDDWIYYTKKVG